MIYAQLNLLKLERACKTEQHYKKKVNCTGMKTFKMRLKFKVCYGSLIKDM